MQVFILILYADVIMFLQTLSYLDYPKFNALYTQLEYIFLLKTFERE